MEVGPGCIETEGVAGVWVGPTAPAIPNQTTSGSLYHYLDSPDGMGVVDGRRGHW